MSEPAGVRFERIFLLGGGISVHLCAGVSPLEADVAFASIAFPPRPGPLSMYVLKALGADESFIPEEKELKDGFAVRDTPAGVPVVFIISVDLSSTSYLAREPYALMSNNLNVALASLPPKLRGKQIWMPLLGSGGAGIPYHLSLESIVHRIDASRSMLEGSETTFRIVLPPDIHDRERTKLMQDAVAMLQKFNDVTGELSSLVGKSVIPHIKSDGNERGGGMRELRELLLSLFTAHELGHFMSDLPGGEQLSNALPGSEASRDVLAGAAVQVLDRHGRINHQLFDAMLDQRSGRSDDIERTRRAVLGSARPPVPEPRDGYQWRGDAPDERESYLTQALNNALERLRRLKAAGQPTGGTIQEILRIKRELRQGGQLRQGDVLGENGRYLLLDILGRGGFAHVWRAFDEQSRKHVAIKVLYTELASDRLRRDRFFRGARIMAELDHDAIVRVVEPYGEDDGYYYFVMELIAGSSLSHAVMRKQVGPDQAVSIALTVGAALAQAHRRGYVHRDIKPDNILITDMGMPKLTDFDLVAAADTTGGTRTGAMGTFIFAPPEMLYRPQDADQSADVYGLAMTVVFMLYGDMLPAIVLRDEGAFIDGLNVTSALKSTLKKALSWDIRQRFVNADAFCQALREAVNHRF